MLLIARTIIFFRRATSIVERWKTTFKLCWLSLLRWRGHLVQTLPPWSLMHYWCFPAFWVCAIKPFPSAPTGWVSDRPLKRHQDNTSCWSIYPVSFPRGVFGRQRPLMPLDGRVLIARHYRALQTRVARTQHTFNTAVCEVFICALIHLVFLLFIFHMFGFSK